MRLIGINGFKRSGKGEVGAAIQSLLDDHCFESTVLVGFADKLKIIGAKSLGFTTQTDEECIRLMDECKEEWIFSILKRFDDQPDDLRLRFPAVYEAEYHRLTGREYLQNLGNEARKVFGEDFWVNQVLPDPTAYEVYNEDMAVVDLESQYMEADCVAFTDLRYENEAQRIHDLGGEVWEVIRPGKSSDGHASEQVLDRDLVTLQIQNKGDLVDLRYEVEKALGI